MRPHPDQAISYLLNLPKAALEEFLRAALTKMDQVLLDTLLGDWQFEQQLDGLSEAAILDLLRDFEHRSQAGMYYKPFLLDATTYSYVPPETQIWYAEVTRWLNYGCMEAKRGNSRHAFELLDICIRLLDDVGNDTIVFADEPGAWMIYSPYDYMAIYKQLSLQ